MSYTEVNSVILKNIFKFYKTQSYDSELLARLDKSLHSLVFQKDVPYESCTDLGGNKTCTDQESHPLWYFIPEEDLFIVRNILSEDTIDQLIRASLIDWTACVPKACNLGELCCSNQVWTDSVANLSIPDHKWDRTLLGKLRWITLGYHYDWNNRRYNESDRSEFPKLLADVSQRIVRLLICELTDGRYVNLEHREQLREACAHFNPEAAIVNYYRGKTTMGFHTDEVEFDKHAPLVSISMGPTAIYLLEVKSAVHPNPHFPHSSEPTSVIPLVLRHGDVVVMLGRSRLAKHAVPTVLFDLATAEHSTTAYDMASRCARQLCPDCSLHNPADDPVCSKCSAIATYLLSTRININVRQVVPFGFRFSDFSI